MGLSQPEGPWTAGRYPLAPLPLGGAILPSTWQYVGLTP